VEKRNTYRLLVGKPEARRPLGKPRHKRVYNNKMDLGVTASGVVDWSGLAHDRDK
jgi:hypothetical protein